MVERRRRDFLVLFGRKTKGASSKSRRNRDFFAPAARIEGVSITDLLFLPKEIQIYNVIPVRHLATRLRVQPHDERPAGCPTRILGHVMYNAYSK